MSREPATLARRLPTAAPVAVLGCGGLMLLLFLVAAAASDAAVEEGDALAAGFTAVVLMLGGVPVAVAGLLATVLRRQPVANLVLTVLGGLVAALVLPMAAMLSANGSAWAVPGLVAGLLVGVLLVGLGVAAYVLREPRR